jgi:hypothetical protein
MSKVEEIRAEVRQEKEQEIDLATLDRLRQVAGDLEGVIAGYQQELNDVLGAAQEIQGRLYPEVTPEVVEEAPQEEEVLG